MQDQAGDPLLNQQIKQEHLFPSRNFIPPAALLTPFESENKKSKRSLKVLRYANQSFTVWTVIFFPHWKADYTNGPVRSQSLRAGQRWPRSRSAR